MEETDPKWSKKPFEMENLFSKNRVFLKNPLGSEKEKA
jgi:hypothetical protein